MSIGPLQQNDPEVVPFSSKSSQAVKNVIWYLCLKLVFIFNVLNLKLEVVKLFQVYRDRNPKEKKSSKSLNFKLPQGIIWFSLSSPFTVLPRVSASVWKFLMCFFMILYYSPKLLSSILYLQWPRMHGNQGNVLHSLTTTRLHSMSTDLPLEYFEVPEFLTTPFCFFNLLQSAPRKLCYWRALH